MSGCVSPEFLTHKAEWLLFLLLCLCEPHAFFQASQSLHPSSPPGSPSPFLTASEFMAQLPPCHCPSSGFPSGGWLSGITPGVQPGRLSLEGEPCNVERGSQVPPFPHSFLLGWIWVTLVPASPTQDPEQQQHHHFIPVSSFNHMPKLRTL